MSTDLYRQAAWLTSFTERYVLSFFYLVYAWAYWLAVRNIWPDLPQGHAADFIDFAKCAAMLQLLLFEGLTLLIGRRPVSTPRNLEEVLVPLATSFFYMAYGAIDWMPAWAQDSLLHEDWQTPVSLAGLAIDTFGTAISLWGVMYLGRSFGIFVAVRKVVMRGPYRFVRHPIYCGYFFSFAGLALTFFCPAAFVLLAVHYSLFIYRARLEEARLAEFSPEYREYMRTTGFVLPKLFRRRPVVES